MIGLGNIEINELIIQIREASGHAFMIDNVNKMWQIYIDKFVIPNS